jgi:hypothetical protein
MIVPLLCAGILSRDVYHLPIARRFHFVLHLPCEIAVWRAARFAADQVMTKCFAQKLGFYEVCVSALYQAPPGHQFFK